MDIICFGQQNWDFCWTGKQHLLTRLARRGHRILYVDRRPAGDRLPLLRAGRQLTGGGFPGVRKIPAGATGSLWVFTPQVLNLLGWRRSQSLRLHHLRTAMRHLGLTAEAVLILHPYAHHLAARLQPIGTVYYAVDEYSAYGTNITDEESEVRRLEGELLARAQICLAVSPRLRERFARGNTRSLLLPNGADLDHFAPGHLERFRIHPDLQGVRAPVLGFIGQVDERLDQDLLRELALRQPQWHIVLAGRIKDGLDLSRLNTLPNVRFLGYQPHESLPRVARAVDVWLLPYRQTDLTHACNPMKVYEYLATGRPVVAVPLDGLVEGREAVCLAEGADGFQRAIRTALENPEEGRGRRLAVAEGLNWENRVDVLEEALRQAVELGAVEQGRIPAAEKRVKACRARRTLPFSAGVNEHGRLCDTRGPGLLHRFAIRLSRMAGAVNYAGRRSARLLGPKKERIYRRILVVRRSRLGDLITILPTLAALRAAYPGAHLALAVQPGVDFRPLLQGMVDEVIHLDFLWTGSRLQRLHRLLAFFRRGFDLVLCGSRTFFLPEALFSGAPRILGVYNGGAWQEQIGEVVPRDLHRHEVDSNLQLVEALAGPLPPERRPPRLPAAGKELLARSEAVDKLLRVPPGVPLLLVHPGANRESRRWPAPLLGRALEQLLDERPDLHLVLTGTLGEKELVRSVIEKLPPKLRSRARDLSGRTWLPDLLALLRRVDAVLCNDTGILHLARAVDVPLAVTAGPENHKLWGPYPIGRAPAVVLRHQVPCAPCGRDACTLHFCLRHLRPEEVARQVGFLLDGRFSRQDRPGRTLVEIVSRQSWRQLQEAGFDLPLVSVLLVGRSGEKLDAAVEAMLEAVEPQSYPRIELIVAGACGERWQDRRDRIAREHLPLRQVAAPPASSWEETLRSGVREAAGELITCFFSDGITPWWRERFAADVAAWLREPGADAYDGGLPLQTSGDLQALLRLTVPAGRLHDLLVMSAAADDDSLSPPRRRQN